MRYEESTQANKWQLSSQIELNSLREHANRRARDALSGSLDGDDDVKMDDATNEDGVAVVVDGDGNSRNESKSTSMHRVYGLSETRGERPKSLSVNSDNDVDQQQLLLLDESDPNYGPVNTSKARGCHPLLSPANEADLISFYCSKIPLLIGPHALLPRCRRDAKVAATACLLFRRFYLSNSVMMHDPKSMLAAAAFLASKVEDCMILVGYLEMGTKEMDAPVPLNDILDAEINLIEGIDFDLLVFSPYKTVLSYTEDLRTFLKTDRGMKLITFPDQDGAEVRRQLVGEDLRPILDAAMKICDDVIVSDIPLMFAPGEVGLASLMVANEYVSTTGSNGTSINIDGIDNGEVSRCPRIDIMGYIRWRFHTNESEVKVDAAAIDSVSRRITKLGILVRELKEGKHGCGNYELDLETLKVINKKLRKCRAWGSSHKKSGMKKKKRKLDGE